jgi:penicillin amidase
MRKLLVGFGVVLVVLVCLGLVGGGMGFWSARQSFPKVSGKVQLDGLKDPVDIVRDEYGVAHIYASTPEDLFFAEGYVHAQERFWQMEFQRRTAAGRLSEIFGEATLPTDKYLRHFNFHALTEQSYAMLDDETRRIVDAYAAGVNAYIDNRTPAQLGLEFALLSLQGVDFEIEKWSSVDSMIWAEIMIYDQSDKLRTELSNIDQLAQLGQEHYSDLHTHYRDDRPTIIPSEELGILDENPRPAFASLGKAEMAYLMDINRRLARSNVIPPMLADLGFGASGGSNSFVVSGEKTDTGKPLLANDPHMAIQIPSLWYEVGMHCKEKSAECIYNFRGFSLPGVPGILIGHNDRIAWGLTNAAFDSEDVFIERINLQNPDQYEVNGQWEDMEIRWEEIKIQGRDDPEVIFVRNTRNGVVATDYMITNKPYSYGEDGAEPFVLSYAWTALEPIRSFQAILKVIQAQNWDDFVDALQYFDAGKQNWLYADVDGNIGYVLPGKVPIRAGGDGTLPVPGWNDDYRWTGFIPYDEMPRAFNPAQGFIATANNPQVRAEDYPYLLGLDQDRGQRAQRITELIQDDAEITIQDMTAIQTDNQSLAALEITPYLKNLPFDDPRVAAARNRLVDWDGQMVIESPEGAMYALFWTQLVTEIFHDKLSEKLWPWGGHPTEDAVYFMLQDENSWWWDDNATTDRVETRDDTLKSAFEQAYTAGVEEFGADLNDWGWGELHTIYFEHATLGKSGISVIENIFNRGPFPTNGSESVVQKTCWSVNEPYDIFCIPALRQVIDLGNLSNSLMIHSVGQSGHPYHPHYDDFIELWRTFQYHPSNWLRTDAETGKYDLLTLEPK